MSVPRPTRALAALAVLLLVACAPSGPDLGPGITVRDSADIRIVENPSWTSAPDLLVNRAPEVMDQPEPLLEIPRSTADGDLIGAPVAGVRDATRLSGGGVAVANGATREIRFYDATGEQGMSFLGRAPGQGGLTSVSKLMTLPGDTIMIQDRLDRLWITGQARWIGREVMDERAFTALRRSGFAAAGEWMADGSYLTQAAFPPERGTTFALHRDSLLLVRFAPEFAAQDTLAVYYGLEEESVDVGAVEYVAVVPPYPKSSTWAGGALDGTVIAGDNAEPEVHLYHPDGRRTWIRWEAEPEQATPEEVREHRERYLTSLRDSTDVPLMELALDRMTLPDRKAFYYRVHIGVGGSPWVRLGTGWSDPTPYLVFTPQGALRGIVRFPGRFTLLEAGPGYALGVVRLEDGRELVRMYEIER